MSVHIDDIGDETPRPIDTTLVDESQFEKLGKGQGAVRKPSHPSARDDEDISKLLPVSNRTLIIMVVVRCRSRAELRQNRKRTGWAGGAHGSSCGWFGQAA